MIRYQNRRLLVQVDMLTCGVLLGFMVWDGAPAWATALLIYVATRPSRLEVGPIVRDSVVDGMVDAPEARR